MVSKRDGRGAHCAKLDMAKAVEIRKLRDEAHLSERAIARRYSVSQRTVHRILRGETYK